MDLVKAKVLKKYIMIFNLINHLCMIKFLQIEISDKNLYGSDKIAIYFIIVMVFYSYLIGFIYDKKNEVLLGIQLSFVLVMWYILCTVADGGILFSFPAGDASDIYFYIVNCLRPIVHFYLIKSSVDYILYSNSYFKKRIDKLTILFLYAVLISTVLGLLIYTLLQFYFYIYMHFYPVLILIFYRKHLREVPRKVRRNLRIFSVALIIYFLSSASFIVFLWYFKEFNLFMRKFYEFINIDTFSLFIYIIFTILIVHIKIVNSILYKKIKTVCKLNKFMVNTGIILFLTMVFLVLPAQKFMDKYIFINVFLFSVSLICVIFYFIITKTSILNYNKYTVNTLNQAEKIKVDVARYLHDDILQSLLAVKNLSSMPNSQEFKSDIIDELSSLINGIRTEIDNYFPDFSRDISFKENIVNMLGRFTTKFKTGTVVKLSCSEFLMLFPPYDIAIYRILKELVNNAFKYASGGDIMLDVAVEDDDIHICIKNESSFIKEVKLGKGLNFIKSSVADLGGKMHFKTGDFFVVEIIVPMNGVKCYEDFIDRRP